MAGARIMARRTSRPGALIAARRLADNPRAAFRAVSGLVLALFITTVAVAVITTQDAKDGSRRSAAPPPPASWWTTWPASHCPSAHGRTKPTVAAPRQLPASLLTRLSRIDGVRGVIAVRADRTLTDPATQSARLPAVPAGLVSCAQLAPRSRPRPLPRRRSGGGVPAVPEQAPPARTSTGSPGRPATSPPASWAASPDGIDIATNGSQPAVEQARTVLENANAYPTLGAPYTLGELSTTQNAVNNAYQQLADVVILASLPIAGCTLAAAIAAGLADRKRPFSLLRLTGARLSMLRRVVALESAVPLLAVAAVAIGTGFSASAMFASVQLQHPLVAPGAAYYLLTAAGIGAALGIIAATFPLLRRITGPEAARNE